MIRKLFAGSAAVSLCLGTVTPALGQEYRFAGFDGPQGANATIYLRVPLGAVATRSRPTFGLTLGVGRALGAGTPESPAFVRQMRVGDLRFSGGGLRHAFVGGFDLANLDESTRLYSAGDDKNMIAIAAALLGISVAACIAISCWGGSDDDEDTSDPDSPGTGPTDG